MSPPAKMLRQRKPSVQMTSPRKAAVATARGVNPKSSAAASAKLCVVISSETAVSTQPAAKAEAAEQATARSRPGLRRAPGCFISFFLSRQASR